MPEQGEKTNTGGGRVTESSTKTKTKAHDYTGTDGNSSLNSLTSKGFDHRMEGSTNSGFDHRDNHESFAAPSSPTRSYNNNNFHGSGSKLNSPKASNGDIGAAAGGGGEPSIGIELQFLPPDQRPGLPGDLLAQLVEPEIEEDTEAAEALRANASIKVGKVGKVARSVNAQTVRKFVKRATLRGHGNKRGKPPRVPPGLTGAQEAGTAPAIGQRASKDDAANQIFVVQEGEYESDNQDEDQASVPSSADSVGQRPHQQQHHESDDYNGGVSPDVFKVAPLKIEDSHGSSIPEAGLGASPSRDKRASRYRSDRYTSVMTGEDQKDIPTEVVAATMEAGRTLMGALDPHNMLQLQRWRRKKKGGKKQRKSYVKGKVIDGRHELYTLSIAVMLGVRTSIARTNTIISSSDGPGKRMLSPQDFMAEEKYEFAPKVCERRVVINITFCAFASCTCI
jgi:hypothetical protein